MTEGMKIDMQHYLPENMTRRTLRKCYSRFFLGLLVSMAVSFGGGIALVYAVRYFAPYLLDSAHFQWAEVVSILINDIVTYLPPLVIFPLFLKALPKAPPIPRDTFSLWELAQASVFCIGIWYLSTTAIYMGVFALENLTGYTLQNTASEYVATLPQWLEVVSVVLVAPFFEELIFRGVLMRHLRGLGDTSAVLLSAFAFAAAHLNIIQFGYAFPLGCVFACVVLLTGSIRDTILLHMLINGFSLLLGINLSYNALVVCSVALNVMMFTALFQLYTSRKHYTLEAGVLPFRARDKRSACLKSAWFWVAVFVLIAGSVLSALSTVST